MLKLKLYPHKSKLLIKVIILLVSHQTSWRETNVLSVIVMGIFKLIVLIGSPTIREVKKTQAIEEESNEKK